MLLVSAIAIVSMRNLFAAVMLTGFYSLLSASWMLVLDAPDVAYTEAAVGAGVSTTLMLAVLARTGEHEAKQATIEPGPLLAALVTGMVLLYAMLDMPAYGDPSSPIHHHVAPDYLAGTAHDIGVANVISAVLASYRGYDTLGETSVVMTAAVGVLALLAVRTAPSGVAIERSHEARVDTEEHDLLTEEHAELDGGL